MATKASTKNMLTGIVVALALVLALVAVLVKTGVLRSVERSTTTSEQETVIETSIIVVSETGEDGSVFHYTMVATYARPKVSSNHTYPYRPKPTTEGTTEDTRVFVEVSSAVHISDENGNPLYDENGEPITQIITYTMPEDEITTTEPTTEYVPPTEVVQVTNAFGRPKEDENGNPITEIHTLEAPPTELTGIWDGYSSVASATTKWYDVKPVYTTEATLAKTIVAQINSDRAQKGLEPLEMSSSLTSQAEANSRSTAMPKFFNDRAGGDVYTYQTEAGGKALYGKIANSSAVNSAMSENTTTVGVGIIKYDGQYYTTVIFA